MKITAIYNPISGNKDINGIKEELKKRFSEHEFEMLETQGPLHATDLAKNAVNCGADIIIAIGGDGTITEIISGILNSPVKLGIIPFGTGNMLAANLEIPAGITKSVNIILNGNTKKIDIAGINDRYFAFMAGCGFDARIMNEVPLERKKKLGLAAYFIEGFIQAFRSKHSSFKIKLDNKKIIKVKALTILIANFPNIAGNIFSIAPHASFSDGLLDVVVISPENNHDYFSILWKILARKNKEEHRKIRYYQAKEIEIKARPNILVQADGDIITKTPVKIKVIPQAIEILTP